MESNENVILWVARDKNGELYLYKNKPDKWEELGIYTGGHLITYIDGSSFRYVTWETGPVRVKETGNVIQPYTMVKDMEFNLKVWVNFYIDVGHCNEDIIIERILKRIRKL